MLANIYDLTTIICWIIYIWLYGASMVVKPTVGLYSWKRHIYQLFFSACAMFDYGKVNGRDFPGFLWVSKSFYSSLRPFLVRLGMIVSSWVYHLVLGCRCFFSSMVVSNENRSIKPNIRGTILGIVDEKLRIQWRFNQPTWWSNLIEMDFVGFQIFHSDLHNRQDIFWVCPRILDFSLKLQPCKYPEKM